MWRHIQLNSDDFLIKHVLSNNNYCLSLTNLVHLWQEKLQIKDIIQRCQEMNPLLEADETTFVDNVFKLIYDKTTEKTLTFDQDFASGCLKLNAPIEGIIFRFKFDLISANAETIFREITVGTFLELKALMSNQKKLIQIILAKDVEIEQYKSEGAVLARKLVETQKFSESEFKELNETTTVHLDDAYKNILEDFQGINTIIEKNLGIKLDSNDYISHSESRTPEKASILKQTQHLSRRRNYVKNLSPSKMKYESSVKDNSCVDQPSTSVKLEENANNQVKKRKYIKQLLR